MKREFLLNFKVGDQPLPKEVIDAIMAENGRDIEAAKKPFADYDTLKTQLETAQKTIPKQKSTLLGGFSFWWSRGECPQSKLSGMALCRYGQGKYFESCGATK